MFKTILSRKLVFSFLASFLLCLLLFLFGQPSILLATDYDFSNSNNYDAKYFTSGGTLPYQGTVTFGDVNGDGSKDLIFADGLADNNGSNTGSVWIIFGGSDLSGDKDLSTSSNYNIRIDGHDEGQLGRYKQVSVGDVNGDGSKDLILGSGGSNTRSNSGSVYVIYSTKIDDVGTSTGNVWDLETTSNFNIRYDGGFADGYLSNSGLMGIADLNADGSDDLVVAANRADSNGTGSGSVYIIYSTLVDDYTTTGNVVDLATSSNYNIRFDGASAGDNLGNNEVGAKLGLGDVNGDGNDDLVVGAENTDYNSTTNGGSAYVFFSTLIDDYSSTGNNLVLSTSSNYNIRYDGLNAYALTNDGAIEIGDVNGDSKEDLVLGAARGYGSDGVAYVMFSTLIDDAGTSTGNNKYITNSDDHHNLRFRGDIAHTDARLTKNGAILVEDVNGDGNKDLILGAPGADVSATDTGALYVIYSTLIDDVGTTTSNYRPLSTSSYYNIRYEGPSQDPIGDDNAFTTGDVNGDSSQDLIIGAWSDDINGSSSGSVWYIDSTLLDDNTGTGNNHDIETSGVYTDKYIGPSSSFMSIEGSLASGDINADGSDDIAMGARGVSSVFVVQGTPSNTAPNAPSSLGGHVDGSYTNDSTPELTFSLTDPDDSDQVKYQIQIDNSSSFSSPVVDYTSALEAEGSKSFIVGQASGSGSYTTGSQGQTLSDGDYYWRVKATDAAGETSSYATANSGSIAFKIDATAPNTPGKPSASSPTTDTTPTWTWDASSDSGSGLATTPYTVEWCDNSSFTDCSSNTDTDADTSYTHGTALADGTWYFRVKATDVAGNVSSYSSNGSVVVDTTEPSDFSLDSPGGGVYVNSQRPTLRWNTSSDSGAGLTKYKLSINNGSSGGGFTIDDIPVSRTTTYEVNKYKVEYDGFSDGDSGNNYISFTTKGHSDWSSDQNEGKLKEGKRSWSVIAVDDAGNEKSKSRDINIDLTTPSLSNIDVSGSNTLFTISGTVSDTKAGSNNDESDYARSDPDRVEIEIIRESALLSTTQANVKLSLDTFCDYSNKDSDTLSCNFQKDVEATFPFGDYIVKVTAFDKAGNSTTSEESLILGGLGVLEIDEREEDGEDLPLPTKTPEPVEKETPDSEDELEVRREGRFERFKKSVEGSVRKIKDTVRNFTERTKFVFEAIVSAPKRVITSFINLFNSPKKVLGLATTSTTNRLGYFIAAIFPGTKTQITDIKIGEVGTTSAVITWKTNHPATSKVNYGVNLEFEESMYDLKPVMEHKVKLEGLSPNTKIYFEVISEGRTTAYDAYRVFTTK